MRCLERRSDSMDGFIYDLKTRKEKLLWILWSAGVMLFCTWVL